MQEFEQKILEQYDIEVSSTRKVRGAVLCETNKGLFLLKEITTSEKRIPALCELYTRLYEQGYHRIDYVVTNRNGEYISALDNGDRYILKKCFVYPIDRIKTSKLRGKKYDVAIAFSGHLNDSYVVLEHIKAAKKIVWAHGLIYQYLLMSPAFEKMYKKFDKIVSINHIDQNDIFYCKPYLKYDIVNIYNPTYRTKIASDEDLGKKYGKYILSVARLEEPKDFITLIEAYNKLSNDIKKEYNLVIVGDGPDREKIKNRIEKLNLNKKVFMVGAQSDVDTYYQHADLFVLSTKSEGLGMVIIEAMGNGCPVISTDAPYGPRDILGSNDYGILCPVGDSEKMSVAIEELLNDKQKRKKFIEKGLVRYKDFEIDTIMKQFYDLVGR